MSTSHATAAVLAALACSCGPASGRVPDGGGTSDGGASTDGSPSDAARLDGATGNYSHTITIDGVNDFDGAAEGFATSSDGYTAYVAWDDTNLYLAMNGADVASSDSKRWVAVYLGTGAGGTTTGVPYNMQQPALPFSADYHLRWKADNSYTNAQHWDGGAWADAAWDFTGDVFQSGEFVELRVPLADIGDPASLSLHLDMINETDTVEWSYAATPASSFTDGYDPDYAAFYDFDLSSTTVPTGHSPMP